MVRRFDLRRAVTAEIAVSEVVGKDEKDATHSANFGVKLKEHCDTIKVPCELVYPGAPDVKHPKEIDFIKAKLLTSAK